MKLELLKMSDRALAKCLQDFRMQNQNSTELNIRNISFNGTRMRFLIHVLHNNGVKNRLSQPVHQLYLTSCSFEDEESIRLLENFFANNEAPATVSNVRVSRLARLLPAFHSNNTVKKLRLEDDGDGIRGADVSKLLEKNQTLTDICLESRCVNVAFIRDMRPGLLASRGRLQSLGLIGLMGSQNGNEVLKELRLIYAVNNNHHGIVLTALDLSQNSIRGLIGGTRLRQLLDSIPGLEKLNVSRNPLLGPEGVSALFQAGSTLMGRLQSLNMEACKMGNLGLAQMVTSIPTDSNAPLVELNLYSSNIQGEIGGGHLARLFLRCKQIKFITIGQNPLGPGGARALAPAMVSLHCLQEVGMGHCDLQHGAEAILTSFAGCPHDIQSLSLDCNQLPPSTLAPLTQFLKVAGKGLAKLLLYGNPRLFATANYINHQEQFFNAIANHNYMRHLHLHLSKRVKEQLLSAVLQNTTLTFLIADYKKDLITTECMRRNKLQPVIDATMEKPGRVPGPLWPLALKVCSPRQNCVGPTLVYGLVQKMMEVNGFDHIAAVYRFEKVRAIKIIRKWRRRFRACIRVQRWWRRQHWLEAANFFRLFRKQMHDQVASRLKENADLHDQVALLRTAKQQHGQNKEADKGVLENKVPDMQTGKNGTNQGKQKTWSDIVRHGK